MLFLCLLVFAAAALIFYFHKIESKMTLCLLITAAILSFPLSIFYYHLRVPADPAAVARPFAPAPVNPLFARAAAVFESVLPYRQASLLTGIMSGSTDNLASDVKSAMTQSGTSYIVGMYGYKIHLLMMAMFGACKRFFSRRMASLLAIAVVAFFIAAANAPISALRAGIMAALALLAEISGKRFDARIALLFTATFMISLDPSTWVSEGFLLSLMSLVGIYTLAPPIGSLIEKICHYGNEGRDRQYLSRGVLSWRFHLATTVAVNLAILPVVTVRYGTFPAISFISNFFIALPFGAVIAMGTALALVGGFFGYAAMLLAPALAGMLSYQLSVVTIFARVTWSLPISFSSPMVFAAYYFVLAWFAFSFSDHTIGTP